jgi:hypothetical protein
MRNFNISTALVVASIIVVLIDSSSAFVTPNKIARTATRGDVEFYSVSPVATTVTASNIALSALPPSEVLSSSFQVASASLESITSSSLFNYFAEKLIDASIPAVASIGVISFFFSQIKKSRGDDENDDEAAESATAISELYNDLYSNTKGSGIMKRSTMNPFLNRGGSTALPKNLGLPSREFLRITSLNEKYDAYDFSLTKATESKAKAAADFRSKSFDRALGLALNAEPAVEGSTVTEFLPPRVKAKLLRAEKKFLKSGMEKVSELQKLETLLASICMDIELEKLGARAEKMNEDEMKVIDVEIEESSSSSSDNDEKKEKDDDDATKNKKNDQKITTGKSEKKNTAKKEDLLKDTTKLQKELKELELDFMQQVLAAVGPKRAIGLRSAILGDIAVRGTGSLLTQMEDRPLSTILKAGADDKSRQKNLFVMDFPGDVNASQLNELREEVTGVIRNAQPGDEVLVVLQSGGGTVTGYGTKNFFHLDFLSCVLASIASFPLVIFLKHKKPFDYASISPRSRCGTARPT